MDFLSGNTRGMKLLIVPVSPPLDQLVRGADLDRAGLTQTSSHPLRPGGLSLSQSQGQLEGLGRRVRIAVECGQIVEGGVTFVLNVKAASFQSVRLLRRLLQDVVGHDAEQSVRKVNCLSAQRGQQTRLEFCAQRRANVVLTGVQAAGHDVIRSGLV